ncbi:endonuclease domain-containing protein [Streptomyces phaeochromogenes]
MRGCEASGDGWACGRSSERFPLTKGLCRTHYMQHRRGKGLAPINVGRAVADERVRLGQYNVTRGFVDQLLTLQQGGCAVCARVHTGGRAMDIDHDHGCCPGPGSC